MARSSRTVAFYRCKHTFAPGDALYLGKRNEQWSGVSQNEAAKFRTRLEAMAALVEVGGIWARCGVLVRVYVKRRNANG